jgi:ParB/RepB/Spo0J family partition protein
MDADTGQAVALEQTESVYSIDWRLIQPGDGRHAPKNDREDFSHVAGLAEDIRANGQGTPAEVTPMIEGVHWIITGGSRWRACQMIDSPLRCLIKDVSRRVQSEKMLSENENRKGLSDMERARAYAGRLAEGWTLDEVARVTGKRRPYIESRVALMGLREDIQSLIDKPGGFDSNYAMALASYGLDENRQGLALATYRECRHAATLDWWRGVCNELAEQQATRGLFDDLPVFGGDLESYAPMIRAADLDTAGLPLPGVNDPPARGLTLRAIVESQIAYWRKGESAWAVRGRAAEAALCKASADGLTSALRAIGDDPATLQPGAVERKTARRGKRGRGRIVGVYNAAGCGVKRRD